MPSLAFLLILALTVIVYWQGLSGPFLIDDYGPLAGISKYGGIHDLDTFRAFILSNGGGPLGRPISLLSFLIDNVSFSDPWKFKYTNLMLHLLNGTLLCWVVLIVEKIRTGKQYETRVAWVAVLVAGLWLLHPFNVSTTLYIVQRMAQFSMLFVLLGMLGYLNGRLLIPHDKSRAYWTMSLSLIIGTLLAVFSKENGCLLPLFILLLEITVFSNSSVQLHRTWKYMFLGVPLILLVGYFIYCIISGNYLTSYFFRPFTLIERLLTEARVLWDYLGSWFFPSARYRGVYADDYVISTGLFSPPSTFFALAGILLLCITGVYRRIWPSLRLGILFFLTGHLIESSIIPLELYFEHRNYLPTVFLFYPVILGFEQILREKSFRYLVAGMLILVSAGVTAQRAYLWGNELLLIAKTVERYPYSERAQLALAQHLAKNGQMPQALHRLEIAEKTLPDSIHVKLHLLMQHCWMGLDSHRRFLELSELFKSVPFDSFKYAPLTVTVHLIHNNKCRGLVPEDAHLLLDSLDSNPDKLNRGGYQQRILHLRGELYASEKQAKAALDAFVKSQEVYPDVEMGMQQVAILASNAFYSEALALLDLVERIYKNKINAITYYSEIDYSIEIQRIRNLLEQDIRDSKTIAR